jgi:WD40 repeat protein
LPAAVPHVKFLDKATIKHVAARDAGEARRQDETPAYRQETSEMKYKAFISYSHAADGKLAPALQRALERFGRAWYQKASIRIFRDETNLALNPGLWTSIAAALADSEYFLLLCSPEAAQSKWVRHEIDYWIGHSAAQKLLIVLTGGEMLWDGAANDFDWSRTTLPRNLARVYSEEPLYMDLRWAHTAEHLSLTNPRFRDQTADVLAGITGRSKDELIGEDVRVQHKARRIAWSAVSLLLVLFIAALGAAGWALTERNWAVAQARIALGRQLAAQAENTRALQGPLIERSLLLGIESARLAPALEADQALRHSLALMAEPGLPIPHAKSVDEMAVSPDGDQLAVVNETDKTATVYRVSARAAIGRVSHDEWIASAAFHPNGKWLATGGWDGTVRLWDTAAFQEQTRLPEEGIVSALAFSRDGTLLASATNAVPSGTLAFKRNEQRGRIHIWSLAGKGAAFHQVMNIEEDGCQALAFHSSGSYLAAACYGTVLVYRVAGMQKIWQVENESAVETVGFSSDGRYLAFGVFEEYAHVHDFQTRELAGTFGGRNDGVRRVEFTPDNRHVVTGGGDGAVRVWDLESGEELRRINGLKMAVVPGGRQIAVAREGEIRLWDWTTEPLSPTIVLPNSISDRMLSPDGRRLLVRDYSNLWISDARSGKLLDHVEYPEEANPLALSPDGRLMVVSETGAVRVEGAESKRPVRALLHRGLSDTRPGTWRAAFSPDGRRLVTASGPQASIWDTQNWAVERSLTLAARPVGIEFSADSRRFLVTDARRPPGKPASRYLSVWEAASGKRLGEVELPGLVGTSVPTAISDDGAYFAAATAAAPKNQTPARLSIWQTATGRPLGSFDLPGKIMSMTFSPDGRLLAGAFEDSTARLWDVATRKQVRVMRHESWVRSVAFDSTGEYMATSGDDATARIWEVRSGREVARMKHDEGVGDARFVPDGRHILTTWKTLSAVSLWPWRLDDLVGEGCRRVTRNFTADEWGLYLPGEPYRKSCPSLDTK